MDKHSNHITQDKCNLCGWSGDSEKTIRTKDSLGNPTYICPVCGSDDIDDISANPYENDDDSDDGSWYA